MSWDPTWFRAMLLVGIFAVGGCDRSPRGQASLSDSVASQLNFIAGDIVKEGPIYELKFTPDGNRLAAASSGSELNLWKVDGLSERVIHSIPKPTAVGLTFLHDGRDIAFVAEEGGLYILSSIGWNETVASDTQSWTAVAASFDCAFLATGNVTNHDEILLLDTESLDRKKILRGHRSFVVSVSFSPNRLILVSGGFDDAAIVWNVETGECLATLRHNSWVESLAFSPDG
ncbi:MAG: hypothetical protein ABI619_01550, partial [Betaproteobacteria bacterium]